MFDLYDTQCKLRGWKNGINVLLFKFLFAGDTNSKNLPCLTFVLPGDPLNSSVYLFEMMLNLPFNIRSVMFPVLNQY